MIDIDKAFEGRWRLKTSNPNDGGGMLLVLIKKNCPEFLDLIKSFCRDFFEAGLALGQRDFVPLEKLETIKTETTLTPEEVKMWSKINTPFDLWWEMYDLKCGKEKCMKKWEKLSEKEKEACIQATPAYVASTPDKQFRKRPLTYLNQKAWNDEIIPRNNGTDNKSTIEEQRRDKLASILTDK